MKIIPSTQVALWFCFPVAWSTLYVMIFDIFGRPLALPDSFRKQVELRDFRTKIFPEVFLGYVLAARWTSQNLSRYVSIAYKKVEQFLHVTEGEYFLPRQAKRVREVANLTERKNPHTSVYGVRKFVCLSVKTLTPIISGLAKQNGLKKN